MSFFKIGSFFYRCHCCRLTARCCDCKYLEQFFKPFWLAAAPWQPVLIGCPLLSRSRSGRVRWRRQLGLLALRGGQEAGGGDRGARGEPLQGARASDGRPATSEWPWDRAEACDWYVGQQYSRDQSSGYADGEEERNASPQLSAGEGEISNFKFLNIWIFWIFEFFEIFWNFDFPVRSVILNFWILCLKVEFVHFWSGDFIVKKVSLFFFFSKCRRTQR